MFAITMAGFELIQNDRLLAERIRGEGGVVVDKVEVEVNRTEPNCYKWIIVQRFFLIVFVLKGSAGGSWKGY